MQQSETNTMAAALTTMMAGASVLTTLANTDIIEVRNSAGALKGKITAQNLAAFAAGSSVPQTAAFADVNSVPFNPMVIGVCNGNTANTPESVWGLFVRFYVATGASSGRGVDLFLPQAAGKGIWLRAVVNNAPHSSGWRKLSLDDMQ